MPGCFGGDGIICLRGDTASPSSESESLSTSELPESESSEDDVDSSSDDESLSLDDSDELSEEPVSPSES
jgi:hypothetical protein